MQFDPVGVVLQPGADGLGAVDRVPVGDDVYLPAGLACRAVEELVQELDTTINGEDGSPGILWVSALSRFSRNSHKQLRVLELLLAHEATTLTTNYMLRPHDVWVRREPLIKPNSHYPLERVTQLRGCLGEHRQVRKQVLDTNQQP